MTPKPPVDEFLRARNHSGLVRFLKIALPITAGLIILGLLIALAVKSFSSPEINIGKISVSDGKLVMQNPELNGVDENQRPYSLSASKATQNVDNPSRVALEAILAKLPIEDGLFATIKAGSGLYDSEAKTLLLEDNVEVVTTDGMQVFLNDADVDIKNGSLKTANPVQASSKEADIAAGSLQVEEGGERLVFEGKVQMTIHRRAFEDDSDGN